MDWFARDYLHEIDLHEIGNTPLVRLDHYSKDLFAKLEWFNPFGSLKDRAVKWMLQRAEKEGKIVRGSTIIIEPTSGNTGIALAGIATSRGYSVEAVVPEKVTEETKNLLRKFGAKIYETTDDLCPRVGAGTDQSIALAKAIVRSHRGEYFMPNQYSNEANTQAHYESTGPEIWRDTGGKITQFVAGIGTGGTLAGVGQYLKEQNPDIKIYAVGPEKGHHLQGLRNLEESEMPEILKQTLERKPGLVDEWIKVSDQEAFSEARNATEKEKLFLGPSSAAVLYAAKSVVEKGNGVTVAIFADDAQKYRSIYTEFGVFTAKEFGALRHSARFARKELM